MTKEVVVFKGVTHSSAVLKGLKLCLCSLAIVKLVVVAGSEVDSNNRVRMDA